MKRKLLISLVLMTSFFLGSSQLNPVDSVPIAKEVKPVVVVPVSIGKLLIQKNASDVELSEARQAYFLPDSLR